MKMLNQAPLLNYMLDRSQIYGNAQRGYLGQDGQTENSVGMYEIIGRLVH